MASPNSTFTEMVTTTFRRHGTGVADNVSEHNALLNTMKRKGKIKSYGGGYEIAEPLEYAENGTYQRYAGYEQLSTEASDVLTAAKYDWQQVAIHVTASGREVRQNMGSKERIINLVKQRIANAKRTAANNFSIDIYSDGALSNQIGGLAHIIQTNGEGTVGGINSATYTFWKNKFKEATGIVTTLSEAESTTLRTNMNQLWLDLNRGADKPDLIVSSHDLYVLYELGQQQLQRYMDSDLAQAGFNSLKFKSANVIFDDNTNFSTTAEKMYFLNTDYLYLVQHKEAQWSQEEEKKPVNQDAIVVPIFWMGNMVCTNRSLQGVLIDES